MTPPVAPGRDTSGWFGHPRGLSTLFFTEMWERFSFYGLKALLILFMTAAAAQGGLGFTAQRAGDIIGWYGFGVYASAIVGGWLADRVFGQYRSVLIGGIIIALGHVSMVIGLIQYVAGKPRLTPALTRLGQTDTHAAPMTEPWWRFTRDEWGQVAAIAVLFVFSSIFWGAFEQASSSLNLFADRLTKNRLFGFDFPSTWYQSLNSMFMIMGLAPLIGWIWVRLGPKQPSSPVKFALGLIFVGLGFALIVPAAKAAQQQSVLVSPWWLIGLYFLHTIGELCLSPVGLSIVTKLAPARIVGAMMGLWFLSIAVGNKLAGMAGGLFETLPLPKLFGAVAGVSFVAALILLAITPWLRKLMGGVR